MLKKIKLQDAVGNKLAHDITEIRPGEFKGPAFRKGHTVCDEDLCHLQKLGKNNLYVIDLEQDEIHENQAAAILANALAGEGIAWKDEPHEGKIKLLADTDGLFKVDASALAAQSHPGQKRRTGGGHTGHPFGHETGSYRACRDHRPTERCGAFR